ncbi:MAG: PIN domain-containing protein [Candidatus Hydrogenedentota bacterium]
MIFVDTSALGALFNPREAFHERAATWSRANRESLVTTDYVVDETLTLLRARRAGHRAIEAGTQLFSGELATIEFVTLDDFNRAWEIFRDYSDKSWSFTDCASRVVMQLLNVSAAFAFDKHFRQFETISVVP